MVSACLEVLSLSELGLLEVGMLKGSMPSVPATLQGEFSLSPLSLLSLRRSCDSGLPAETCSTTDFLSDWEKPVSCFHDIWGGIENTVLPWCPQHLLVCLPYLEHGECCPCLQVGFWMGFGHGQDQYLLPKLFREVYQGVRHCISPGGALKCQSWFQNVCSVVLLMDIIHMVLT